MRTAVIVPSLNPDEKLMEVVNGLLAVGFKDIILVNDGSDEEHTAPFREAAQHEEVTVLTHEVNKGKGVGLKTAFRYLQENRPDITGAVTADGDNQHKATDILRCAAALEANEDKLWLGVRDFSLEHVPPRSRFGNNMTRAVMRLAGVNVSDTQTGLRGVSAKYFPLMLSVYGDRYEYETEMLMAVHDAGIPFGELVIETVYIDENQTSHFNPLRDSWKIYKVIFRHIFRNLGALIRFSLSSIFCFLIDYGLFTVLNLFVLRGIHDGSREIAATYGARVVSSIVNFCLNRNAVFKSKRSVKSCGIRYFALVIVQAAVSGALVALIHLITGSSNAMETVIKIPVDILLFFASYGIQKKWIFTDK